MKREHEWSGGKKWIDSLTFLSAVADITQSDVAAVADEGLVTGGKSPAVRGDLIAAPRILSEPFAGGRLVRTQPAVTSFEVRVPVALDLFGVRVPVYAWSYLAKVRHLTAEVDDRPKSVHSTNKSAYVIVL